MTLYNDSLRVEGEKRGGIGKTLTVDVYGVSATVGKERKGWAGASNRYQAQVTAVFSDELRGLKWKKEEI